MARLFTRGSANQEGGSSLQAILGMPMLTPKDLRSQKPRKSQKIGSSCQSRASQRYRLMAQFGGLALSEEPSESEFHGYQQQKGQLQEQIQHLDLEIDNLKQQRKQTTHHIPVKSLPEQDRFTRLRTERKHFVDTIKMIGYRAETSLASLLREHLARSDDARAFAASDLQQRSGLGSQLGRQHPHRSAPPSCTGCPRPGPRTALRHTQRNRNCLPRHEPHSDFRNWLIWNSTRSGGLKVGGITETVTVTDVAAAVQLASPATG